MPLTQQEIRDKLGVIIKVGEVFTFEDADILWPNFSGAKDTFNAEGDRNFNLRITEVEAEELAKVGWNVKCKPARPDDPDAGERCVLKIKVKFENKPPKIVMIGSKTRSRTELHAGIAGLVDSAEIEKCDLSFVPYFWDVNGSIGVSAYLRTMYLVVVEDDLDKKWAEEEEASHAG